MQNLKNGAQKKKIRATSEAGTPLSKRERSYPYNFINLTRWALHNLTIELKLSKPQVCMERLLSAQHPHALK
jgi:hypothetical protein